MHSIYSRRGTESKEKRGVLKNIGSRIVLKEKKIELLIKMIYKTFLLKAIFSYIQYNNIKMTPD